MTDVYKAAAKQVVSDVTEVTRKSVERIRQTIEKSGSESLFTSFATFPKTICFAQQDKGEAVILFVRQHFIVNATWILMVLVALLMQAFFPIFPPYANLPSNYQLVITAMWYLLVSGFALAKFMGWFFNIFILTDERVIDVDFVNLFMRRISFTKIEEIQDVSSTTAGAAGTFFGFGNVTIQTAGEIPEFEMHNVPNSDEVVKIVNELIDQEEQEKLEGRVK